MVKTKQMTVTDVTELDWGWSESPRDHSSLDTLVEAATRSIFPMSYCFSTSISLQSISRCIYHVMCYVRVHHLFLQGRIHSIEHL